MFEEKVYSTICPGCGLGCGLYIRESAGPEGDEKGPGLIVDFRKNAPVNAGKLCRFGMKLPAYYGKVQGSKVNGKEENRSEAITAASEALKAAPAESLAFLSVGNCTNEEQQAFTELAGAFSSPVETGMGICAAFPASLHKTLGSGAGLEEVEAAKQVFLFIDPYVQYPLALRRIIRAKKNGAGITAVGPKLLPLADENLALRPDEYKTTLSPGPDSVLLADLHPYSDPAHVKAVLELAGASGAKLLFLRPFVNSKGAALLAKHTRQRSFEKLLEAVEAGEIKTLFCLDSDLSELSLEPERVKEALSKLDKLIVQASHPSPLTEFADIVIGAEPFYRKKGTVFSAEGRLLEAGGDSTLGFEALSELAKAAGKEESDFGRVQKKVFEAIGLSAPDEFKAGKANPVSCRAVELRQVADSVKAGEEPEGAGPERAEKSGQGQRAVFSHVFSPFMWHGVEDDNDFVELNFGLVRKLGLSKGGSVNIKTPEVEARMRFKVSDLADGFVLSGKKVRGIALARKDVELSR